MNTKWGHTFFPSAQNNNVLTTHKVLWVCFRFKSTISLIRLSVPMSLFFFCFVLLVHVLLFSFIFLI